MNGWELLEAVGRIDPAFIAGADETAAVIQRARRRRRTVALAACLAAAVACAVLLTLRRLPQVTPPTQGEEGSVVIEAPSVSIAAPPTDVSGPTVSTPGAVAEPTSAPVTTTFSGQPETPESSPEPVTSPNPDGDGTVTSPATSFPDNGLSGGPPTLEYWSADAPTVRGTGYTKEELDALLRRESFGIAQAVAAETGCAVGDVQICADGWCHTSLGETNVVDLDYLTLPVCVGDRVVASVDLFRVNGEVSCSVSAGGPRWDNLNRALQYGEVAFVYAGYGELAAAADGTVFEITVGASEAVTGQDDLYARVAAPQTVYSLSRLQNAAKY